MIPAPTERLRFRAWTIDDAPLAEQLWGDPQVMAWLGGPLDVDAAHARLEAERTTYAEQGLQYWPLEHAGEFVGCCGLRPAESAAAELGFHLLPAYWGQGLASEAARGAIAHAFDVLELPDLFAGHHPENAASQRLLLKLGFARSGEVLYAPTGLMHPAYVLTR